MFQTIFGPIIYIFREKKKLMALMVLMSIAFAILIFPYDDLSDLITDLVAKNSNNQVFVQFDDLGIGFLPPSLKMSNVAIDTPALPTIKAKKLYLAPNIAGLLALSPGFSAVIEDVLKGEVDLDLRAGKKVSDKVHLQNASVNLRSVDLKSLTTFVQSPIELQGQLAANVDAQIDPSMTEQPEGPIVIELSNFHIPSATVPTMMGAISYSNIEISHITIKGELRGGNLDISEGTIGKPGDSISGRIKGRLGVRMRLQGTQVVPDFGAYEFKIDINLDRLTEKSFGPYLNAVIDKYRTVTGTGTRYAFRLNGQGFNTTPNPSQLGSW